MAVIEVPGRISGRNYSVRIAGDTPSSTEQERIRQYLDEQESAFSQSYEQSFGQAPVVDDGTALGRGWERGKASGYSALGTAAEYLGSGLGIESLVGLGQGMRESGDYESFLESLRQPAPMTRENVTGLGSALTYLGEGIGQSGPEMAASLGATAAGTIAAGPAVGLTAGAVTAFPSFFGHNIQRQEAEVAAGRLAEIDTGAAVTAAIGQSALNAIGDKLLLGGFLKPGQKWLTRTVVGAGEGAATEIPTEIAQTILERKQAGMPLDDDAAISEYVDAGILGGFMGGGIRATTAGLGIDMKRPVVTPPAAGRVASRIIPAGPGPISPGPATTGSKTTVTTGGQTVTRVKLSDGAVLEFGSSPTQAQIDAALAQYNATKEAPPPPATGGVSVDEDVVDVQSVFEARRARLEEAGATPAEARAGAASTALDYMGTLPADLAARLSSHRSALERAAGRKPVGTPPPVVPPRSTSSRGDMPPALPDAAYASEFGPTGQPDLFGTPATKATPATGTASPPPALSNYEAEADAFERAVPPVAAPVAAPKAEREADFAADNASPAAAPEEDDLNSPNYPMVAAPVAEEPVAEEPAPAPAPGSISKLKSRSDLPAKNVAELEARLAEARAAAATLREGVPADVLKRTMSGDEVPAELYEAGEKLQVQVNWARAAANTAKAAVPAKPTHPARPKSLAAYNEALTKLRDLETQLAAAQETLSVAELSAAMRRRVDTAENVTEKDQKAYVKYVGALREAHGLRQALDTERARAEALEPPAPTMPDLNTPVVPDAWLTAQRGMSPPVPAAPSQAVADTMVEERVLRRLAAGFIERTTEIYRKLTSSRGAINNRNSWVTIPDQTTLEDKQAVLTLLGRVPNEEQSKRGHPVAGRLTPQETAASLYFSKVVRPQDAIDLMIDDTIVDYDVYREQPDVVGEEAALKELFRGTGSKAAKLALEWVRANMSPKTNRRVDNLAMVNAQWTENQQTWTGLSMADLNNPDTDLSRSLPDRVVVKRAAKKKHKEDLAAALRDFFDDARVTIAKMAKRNPLVGLDTRLHYTVKMALANGNLRMALRALAVTSPSPDVRALATALADRAGTTRVEIAEPGTEAFDVLIAQGADAVYSHWTATEPYWQNLILLHPTRGVNAHALLHEMMHPVTFGIVRDQPNHPVTKQLQALLESVRKEGPAPVDGEYPDGFYGLTNVEEFVAEVMGRVGVGYKDNGLRDLMSRTMATRPGAPPLTNWQWFLEIIANMVNWMKGRPTRPWPRRMNRKVIQETTLDATERLIKGIMSPAQQVLPATVLADAATNPTIARLALRNAVMSAPVWDAEGRERLQSNLRASWSSKARQTLLGALQLDWLADIAGKWLPEVRELKRLDDLKRGYFDSLYRKTKVTMDDISKFLSANPDGFRKLMVLEGQATLAGVDPTKPGTDYDGDQEKLSEWDALSRRLAALGPDAKALFQKLRNHNTAYRKEIESALWEQVKAVTADEVTRNNLYTKLMEKLTSEGVIDPYFSLMREGDFWLAYTAEDLSASPTTLDGVTRYPPDRFVHAFSSAWERDRVIQKIKAARNDRGEPVLIGEPESFMRQDAFSSDRSVQPEFIQSTLQIINNTLPGREFDAERGAAVAAIQDLFMKFTPAHSLLRSFTKRKGVRGFIGDVTPAGIIDTPHNMAHVLAEKASSMAQQLANMKYGAKVQALTNKAQQTYSDQNERSDLNSGDKVELKAYYEEFKLRAAFVKNPKTSRGAQLVRGIAFNMTLGFNISGMTNALFQIPMVAYPILTGRYGSKATLRAIGFATKMLANAGKTYRQTAFGAEGDEARTQSDVDHVGTITNYFEVAEDGTLRLRTDADAPNFLLVDANADPASRKEVKNAELRRRIGEMDVLAEFLSSHGMLTHSQGMELLAADNNLLTSLNRWSGFGLHHAERYNRQATAVAAYTLALDKVRAADGSVTRADKVAAAEEALFTTEEVNGSIGHAAGSRIGFTGIGSVIMLFKNYGLSMARTLVKITKAALKTIDQNLGPEHAQYAREQRAIARYQLGGLLGTAALFSGVQGLPFFGELMSLLNALFTDDDEDDFETMLQKYIEQPFYHGAVNYLTGAEVASRISFSGLFFRENKIQKDQFWLYDLIETFGGPAVGVAMNASRGVDLIAQGEVYRGVEAMAPAVVRNLMKSGRYGFDGARTIRGDEIVPLSKWDVALQMTGYTPAVYARRQEAVSGERKIRESIRKEKGRLYRKYFLAQNEGDYEEAREIWREMQEFSQRNPTTAITRETLKKSMDAYKNRTAEMISGVSFSKSDRPLVLASLAEYGDDPTLWSGE